MKNIFLIALCFALVFALGGVAGWMLKPAPPATATLSAGETLFHRLDEKLHFTAAQKESLRALCAELGVKMEGASKGSGMRRETFDHYAPRIREQLTPAQIPAYDEMVAYTRALHARPGQ